MIRAIASTKLFLAVTNVFLPSDKYLINLNWNIAYKSIDSRKLAIISRNGIISQRWAKRQKSKLKAKIIWKTWKQM
jgi:ribosomal protein S20